MLLSVRCGIGVAVEKPQTMLKLLVAIASYGDSNDRYLARIIQEYRSMSFKVDIVVFSNIRKNVGEGVEVHVGLPDRDPRSLPFAHKQVFAERRDEYDLFLYSEDDILVTETNIRAFLRAEREMQETEIPGFFRFEESARTRSYPEIHGSYHWDSTSVRSRGEFVIAFFTNEHAACYLLTARHLWRAIESGGYLVNPHQGRYDLQCSAATDPYTQCKCEKVIPISHVDEFLVHHLPNKYIGTRWGVQESEFRRQISTLLKIGVSGFAEKPLLAEEHGLSRPKDYYELPDKEIVSAIKKDTRTVLSIGCGWGATEAKLVEGGAVVTAIPMDSVIPGFANVSGVELVYGDLAIALKKLTGRQFDCFLFSDILHLVEEPVSVLVSIRELASDGAVIVAKCPNMGRLRKIWTKAEREQHFVKGDYQTSGFHFSSQKVLIEWCERAGLRVSWKAHYFLSRTRQRLASAMFGLADHLLSEKCLVVAKKEGNVGV